MLLSEERLRSGRAAVIECPEPGCSVCISACGFSAIRLGEDGLPFSDPSKCVGCGGCVSVCPHCSIRLLRDKGAGEYEVTLPWRGEFPEIGESVALPLKNGGEPVSVRVIQAVPRRAANHLLRVAAPISAARQ